LSGIFTSVDVFTGLTEVLFIFAIGLALFGELIFAAGLTLLGMLTIFVLFILDGYLEPIYTGFYNFILYHT